MQQHIQQIANAIQYLASVCDGAKSRDFQGFSSFDKNLGHYLADKIASNGTLKVRFAQDGRLVGRVAALKAAVPADARDYDPARCTWTIRCDFATDVETILGSAVAV